MSTTIETPKRRKPAKSPSWTQDPERVRRDILDVAQVEFAKNGLSGARVDEIAARTATSKRMIYYYFKDKAGLYLAVLEEAYAGIRAVELNREFEALSPVEALRQLAGLTFDYHAAHPDFVRLVMVENIHQARHLKMSDKIAGLNRPAITMVEQIYRRGVAQGRFRAGIEPLDIHLTLSALSFYNVSNQASIAQVFGHDMSAAGIQAQRREIVIETLLRFVLI